MANSSFSLTERAIINPVLYLQAEPIKDPRSTQGIRKKIWHFVEAEIFARVTALFTAIFAATDAFVHFFSGCYKGIYLLLGKCCNIQASWEKSEVYEHFRGAALFSGIAIVGSIAGAIWPGVVKYFKQSPSDPDENTIQSSLPGAIYTLVTAVQSAQEEAPFDKLQNFWRTSSLSSKRTFVQAFNQPSEPLKMVRRTLANMVYRPIAFTPLAKRQVQWLNEKEVTEKVNSAWEKTSAVSKGFFFHATSEKSLESILKDKKIEVRHEKLYRGAFVSTKPELGFGRCVLAFKRNIERLSTLEHGFTISDNTYWAGFSRDIPVSENTLACIVLDSRSEEERQLLETQCEQWTNRKIEVILIGEARKKSIQVASLKMGIPEEWPEEGEQAGLKILNAMKQEIHLPVQLEVPMQRCYA